MLWRPCSKYQGYCHGLSISNTRQRTPLRAIPCNLCSPSPCLSSFDLTFVGAHLPSHIMRSWFCTMLYESWVKSEHYEPWMLWLRVNEEDIQKKGNPSPSHCIHHLCIETPITTSIDTRDHSINALQRLIDVDGLRRLSDLTLHINSEYEWDRSWSPDVIDNYLTLLSLFLENLRKKCPHLKNVYLTDRSQEFENKWIEREFFSIKVYNRPS